MKVEIHNTQRDPDTRRVEMVHGHINGPKVCEINVSGEEPIYDFCRPVSESELVALLKAEKKGS